MEQKSERNMKSPSRRQQRTTSTKTTIDLEYQGNDNKANTTKGGTKHITRQQKSTIPPLTPNGNVNKPSYSITSPLDQNLNTTNNMVSPGRRRFTLATSGMSETSARNTVTPRRHTLYNNYVSQINGQPRPQSQNRSKGTTPRPLQQTRAKSAKPETSNGNVDENGVSGDSASENSDSVANDATTPSLQRPVTPWQMFEEQIKSIDDSSLMCFKKENTNFKASDAFKETMGELYSEHIPEETPSRAGATPSVYGVRFTNLARFALNRRNTEINEKQMALKLAARRGWNKIRRNIQEAQMQRKNSEANMGWRFLQATLRNMTDMERARQDLYKRYLFQPIESEIDRVPPRLLSPQFNKTYTTLVKQRQNSNGAMSTPRARSARPERPKMAKRRSMAELFSDAASIE